MEPDFYRQYKDLPVPELVKVARTPADYLPEAVAAAERILRERGITKEEMVCFAPSSRSFSGYMRIMPFSSVRCFLLAFPFFLISAWGRSYCGRMYSRHSI